jgi:hypothetical protein
MKILVAPNPLVNLLCYLHRRVHKLELENWRKNRSRPHDPGRYGNVIKIQESLKILTCHFKLSFICSPVLFILSA